MPLKSREVPAQICLVICAGIKEIERLAIPETGDGEKWRKTLAKMKKRLTYLAKVARRPPEEADHESQV